MQGVAVVGSVDGDDWSSQRSIQYDQAVVNRWKTDCLRFLRTAWGAEGSQYREFGEIVDRSGVLWRAIEPGMLLLQRLRAGLDAEGAGVP